MAAGRGRIVAVLGWMALDLGIGLVMAVLMLLAWYAAEALAGALGPILDLGGLRRAVRRRLGAAVPRPPLRRQAAGAARQHLPGLHRPDVPGRRGHGDHGPSRRSAPMPWARVTSTESPGETTGLICTGRRRRAMIRTGRNRSSTNADQAHTRLGTARTAGDPGRPLSATAAPSCRRWVWAPSAWRCRPRHRPRTRGDRSVGRPLSGQAQRQIRRAHADHGREAGDDLQQLLRVRQRQEHLARRRRSCRSGRGRSRSAAWSRSRSRSASTICWPRCRSRSASTAIAASRPGR